MANVASVRSSQVIRFNMDSDFAAAAALNYVVQSKAEIMEIEWVRTDAVGGGFFTITNGGLVTATVGSPANQYDVVRANNIQNVSISAGGTLNLTASANTIRGRLYITILPGI